MVAAALAIVAAYAAFVLLRLGVHQRLPLALRPISLERIPDRAARRHGDRPLFTCDVAPAWHVPALRGRYASETQWTALRIKSTAGFVAALMRGLGVTHGDRVAILKANHFDIHVLVTAVVRAGAIACPMNGRFPASKVEPYIENIGASALITDVPTLSRVLSEGGALGGVTTIVFAAKRSKSDQAQRALLGTLDSRHGRCRVIWLEDALAAVAEEVPASPREATEPVYLVHSSGTTGFPKAVTLTNDAQSHAVRGWLAYVHVSRSYDRGLLAVPANHQAVILTFNSALLLGLPIHWTSACAREDFDADRVAAELSAGRYTGFFGFPLVYTLLKEMDWTKHDVRRMRFWASTADAAHAVIQRVFFEQGGAFRSLGLPLRGSVYLDAQGSSEVGTPSVLRYLTAYTRHFDRRIGRPGSTPFGPHIRIATESGHAVPAGEVGRLEVKGRTLFAGYWNNLPMTRAAFCDGWFFTGDVVRQAPDGHLVQLDREVDVIHTARGPVYSLPVEERLHAHPSVFDVCVYGARQPDGTQEPAAAVAVRAGVRVGVDQLTRELNALLHAGEQLASVEIMDWGAFPIGITGKTLKRVFRERTEPLPQVEMNRPDGLPPAGPELQGEAAYNVL